jgi:hypothetical protein
MVGTRRQETDQLRWIEARPRIFGGAANPLRPVPWRNDSRSSSKPTRRSGRVQIAAWARARFFPPPLALMRRFDPVLLARRAR